MTPSIAQREIEDRRWNRHPAVLKVSYPDYEGRSSDWTENVSSGGLFVRAGQPEREPPVAMGQRLRVALSTPGCDARVEVSGRVRWIRETGHPQGAGLGLEVERSEDRRKFSTFLVSAMVAVRGACAPRDVSVLLVGDTAATQRAFAQAVSYLQSFGAGRINYSFVSNSDFALALMRARCPDLLIVDHRLDDEAASRLTQAARADEGGVVYASAGTTTPGAIGPSEEASAQRLMEQLASILHQLPKEKPARAQV